MAIRVTSPRFSLTPPVINGTLFLRSICDGVYDGHTPNILKLFQSTRVNTKIISMGTFQPKRFAALVEGDEASETPIIGAGRLTKAVWAKELRITPYTVTGWLRHGRKPSWSTIRHMGEIAGVRPEWLLGETEDALPASEARPDDFTLGFDEGFQAGLRLSVRRLLELIYEKREGEPISLEDDLLKFGLPPVSKAPPSSPGQSERKRA